MYVLSLKLCRLPQCGLYSDLPQNFHWNSDVGPHMGKRIELRYSLPYKEAFSTFSCYSFPQNFSSQIFPLSLSNNQPGDCRYYFHVIHSRIISPLRTTPFLCTGGRHHAKICRKMSASFPTFHSPIISSWTTSSHSNRFFLFQSYAAPIRGGPGESLTATANDSDLIGFWKQEDFFIHSQQQCLCSAFYSQQQLRVQRNDAVFAAEPAACTQINAPFWTQCFCYHR